MKKILFTLFFFSILFVSYASVQKDKNVSTFLYGKSQIYSLYNKIETKLYFKNIFRVSTTATVLYPSNANKNDLPNDAIICPGPVTLHSKIESYFAKGNSWDAKMSVAVSDDNESQYENYKTINEKEFEYSKNKYEAWYSNSNFFGDNPFSNTAEPVTFSPKYDMEFKDKKGFAGGAVKAKSIFSTGGANEKYFYFDGGNDELDWTSYLGEGSYDVSSQLNVEGVTIGLTRKGDYLRTAFYSYIKDGDDQKEFHVNLSEASIHIDVFNASDISMDVVSRDPGDPVPLPTNMTIKVKNTGQIPIKVTSASITQGYSIITLYGFDQEIQPDKEHTLLVYLNTTKGSPSSSATITLNYQSSGPTCDGNVKTKQLKFTINTSVTGPDLSPKITWHLPLPFEDNTSAEIIINDCNQFMEAGAHDSNYSIKTNDGSNVIKEETVRVNNILGQGNCSLLYAGSVVCTKNIIVTACSDVKNEVTEDNENNNCIIEIQNCSGGGPGAEKNCTLRPYYTMFIPPSSKDFKLFCGEALHCAEASWKLENLSEHVSITAKNYTGATVSVYAEAPPQKGKLVADAKFNGEKYTCSSAIDIIKSECEDYV